MPEAAQPGSARYALLSMTGGSGAHLPEREPDPAQGAHPDAGPVAPPVDLDLLHAHLFAWDETGLVPTGTPLDPLDAATTTPATPAPADPPAPPTASTTTRPSPVRTRQRPVRPAGRGRSTVRRPSRRSAAGRRAPAPSGSLVTGLREWWRRRKLSPPPRWAGRARPAGTHRPHREPAHVPPIYPKPEFGPSGLWIRRRVRSRHRPWTVARVTGWAVWIVVVGGLIVISQLNH